MDFVEGFPNSKGKEIMYMVVDKLSKVVHFMVLSYPYSATEVTQLDNVFKLHGFPYSITGDRDPIFINQFSKDLMAF